MSAGRQVGAPTQSLRPTAHVVTLGCRTNLADSLANQRRQSEALFEAGEHSLLELLDVRRRLIDLEATRLQAKRGTARAVIQLEEAMGRTCMAR